MYRRSQPWAGSSACSGGVFYAASVDALQRLMSGSVIQNICMTIEVDQVPAVVRGRRRDDVANDVRKWHALFRPRSAVIELTAASAQPRRSHTNVFTSVNRHRNTGRAP